MDFDNQKLIGRIVEKFGKQYAFAKALGTSEHSLSAWLTGKSQPKRDMILRMADLLEIPDAEIGSYFFARKVQSA
jgi:transcriptional regulator with XRE-family HTH domain